MPHEIWTDADFTSSSLARLYWWSSHVVAAGAVLVWRVGLPVWRTLRHGITVTSVTRESRDVVIVRMGGRGLHRLPVKSGQFFIWRFLDGPGWSRGNPYSLSAAPRHDSVQITAKDLGGGSGRLGSLQLGTRVLIEGPYGRLTGEQRVGDRVAMIACGIGITPLRALLRGPSLRPRRRHAGLPHARGTGPRLPRRARGPRDRRGVTVHYLLGPRMHGRASWLPESARRWRDAYAVERLVPDLLRTDVFVCGPDPWMDAVAAACTAGGLPPEQLHQERFTW